MIPEDDYILEETLIVDYSLADKIRSAIRDAGTFQEEKSIGWQDIPF